MSMLTRGLSSHVPIYSLAGFFDDANRNSNLLAEEDQDEDNDKQHYSSQNTWKQQQQQQQIKNKTKRDTFYQ